MKLRSILITLGTTSLLAVGCAANVSDGAEPTGATAEEMSSSGGGVRGVQCAANGFDGDAFEYGLEQLSCYGKRSLYNSMTGLSTFNAICPTYTWAFVYCPTSGANEWETAAGFAACWANTRPYYSAFYPGGGDECGLPVPAGDGVMYWDPGCSGSNCGAPRHGGPV
jgi:hypothetical protein